MAMDADMVATPMEAMEATLMEATMAATPMAATMAATPMEGTAATILTCMVVTAGSECYKQEWRAMPV